MFSLTTILVFVLYYYREAISRVSEAAGLKTASKRKKVGLYIYIVNVCMGETFRINPEFRILRLTFHRKSASKC